MALGIYEEEDIRALAEEIRNWKGGGSPMTVKEMKDEIQNVRESGFSDGWSDGYFSGTAEGREQGRAEGLEEGKAIGYTEGKTDGIAEGVEQGRKSQYDEFWDAYQNNDQGGAIDYAFAGYGWTLETFKPKYDIIIVGQAMGAFNANQMKIDLVELLSRLGKKLDFTRSTNISTCFSWSAFTRIGEVCVNSTGVYSIFNNCANLVTIDKLIVKENITYNSWFNACPALENLTIEGVIGQNGFNVQWSTKLSKASITSIINALSTTTSGLTVTISKTAVNNVFAGGSEGDEWLNLVATKNNWTISLV